MIPYNAATVTRAYHWLDHTNGATEISILHPAYQPGDHNWNQQHQSWPITKYIKTSHELLAIIHQHAGTRMICYGLNPRPGILTKPNGRPRSAKENDITHAQTLLLDLDLHGTSTPARLQSLKTFLDTADEYLTSLGINRPTRASTGRGSHLLHPYPPLTVTDTPDLRDRLKTFKNNFTTALRQQLDRLEVRVDSTQDLRRMVRAYGTTKPTVGITSQFYATQRHPDPALREYLLNLTVQPTPPSEPLRDVHPADHLPDWFTTLLETDTTLSALWHGNGKPAGTDHSSSGYDYTITTYLLQHGITDPDTLATILTLRPGSHAHHKSKSYLQRTITNALAQHRKT
jgi:hypothetical protein